MKTLFIALTAIIWPFLLTSQVQLNNYQDSISYAIGKDVGDNLAETGIELNLELIKQGMQEGLNKSENPTLSSSIVNSLINKFRQEAKLNLNRNIIMEQKKQGQAFLAENAKKEGVVVLPSGLQYKELKAGEGTSPLATDKVTVHYEGKLINGTVFDSSYQRGAPATFGVRQVISGWTEALQLMKPGAKWQLFLPSDLAYGDRGAGRDIPPGATLIFDVELISVN